MTFILCWNSTCSSSDFFEFASAMETATWAPFCPNVMACQFNKMLAALPVAGLYLFSVEGGPLMGPDVWMEGIEARPSEIDGMDALPSGIEGIGGRCGAPG